MSDVRGTIDSIVLVCRPDRLYRIHQLITNYSAN